VKPLSIDRSALVVVDVQKGFDNLERAGMRRNNPDAVTQISRLLAAFRSKGARVIHIRHAGLAPTSAFRQDGSGYPVQDAARTDGRTLKTRCGGSLMETRVQLEEARK